MVLRQIPGQGPVPHFRLAQPTAIVADMAQALITRGGRPAASGGRSAARVAPSRPARSTWVRASLTPVSLSRAPLVSCAGGWCSDISVPARTSTRRLASQPIVLSPPANNEPGSFAVLLGAGAAEELLGVWCGLSGSSVGVHPDL